MESAVYSTNASSTLPLEIVCSHSGYNHEFPLCMTFLKQIMHYMCPIAYILSFNVHHIRITIFVACLWKVLHN